MRIAGIEILKAGTIDSINTKLKKLEDQATAQRTRADLRALYSYKNVLTFYPSMMRLRALAEESDLMQSIIGAITNEAFRNEWKYNPRFESKCLKCNQEISFEATECPNCKSTNIVKPDPQQKMGLQKFLDGEVNANKQTLQEVLKQLETDHLILDNSFLQATKNYLFDDQGNIVGGKIVELIRIRPEYVDIMADEKGRRGYTEAGEKARFCVEHRENLITSNVERCPLCGKQLLPAWYALGRLLGESSVRYYAENEILHSMEFNPNLVLAPPIMFSVWRKVEMLINLDEYNRNVFGGDRTPNKFVIFNNTSPSTIQRIKDWVEDQVTKNPKAFIPLGLEGNGQRDTNAQILNLTDPALLENAIELVIEARKQVGSVYGVSPVFLADVSTSGGLNNEGLQVTVTNRATERTQAVHNKILAWITKQFGVTDWVVELNPSEERDEAAEAQLELMKAQRAQAMTSMGFQVVLGDDGEFNYSGKAKTPTQNNFTPTTPLGVDFGFQGAPQTLAKSLNQKKKETELRQRLTKELEKLIREADFKAADSTRDLMRKTRDLVGKLFTRFKDASATTLQKVYLEAVKNVETELGRKIPLTGVDDSNIARIKEDPTLLQSFESIQRETEDDLFTKIREGLNVNKTPQEIAEELGESVTEKQSRVELIARVESQHASNTARMTSYDKVDDGSYKYRWVSTPDNRRTKFCERITERTKDGVSKSELLAVIEAMADPNWYRADHPLTPHANCRSGVIRVVQ